MKKLFEDLYFDVDVHEEKTAAEMNDIFAKYAGRDHEADQAFVCVIMSHGYLGSIYGVDGQPVEITSITEKFASCMSLKGKPKLFFIQACQKGVKGKAETSAVEGKVVCVGGWGGVGVGGGVTARGSLNFKLAPGFLKTWECG